MKECFCKSAAATTDVFCHSPYLFRVRCRKLDETSQYTLMASKKVELDFQQNTDSSSKLEIMSTSLESVKKVKIWLDGVYDFQ